VTAAHPAPLALETDRLLLRALAPGDEAVLERVFARSADHFTALTGRTGPAPEAAREELRAAAETPGREVVLLTLRASGEPVGALGWWEGNPLPDRALLGMLMVDPAHRGAGLAREALHAVEVWLAGRGVRALRTAFQRRRLAVHPVVRALGFREMSIAEHTALGLAGAGVALWEKPVGG
jgi:GNAT superfamily N-acetyltransferase